MGNELKINIIGESMSGKTSFIANLLTEKQGKELKKFIDKNKQGQTKIKTKYIIGNFGTITIEKIQFNEDINKKKLEDLNFDKKLLDKYDENCHCINNIAIDFTDDFFNIFYDEIINSIDYKNIIECVEIKCSARDEVLEVLRSNNIDSISFIDTRGFDDCIEEDLKKFRESEKMILKDEKDENDEISNRAYQSLLAERGILESNLTILFTDKSGLKLTKDKDVYKKFIMEVIKMKPLVVISRSALLTDAEERGASYDELIKCINSNKTFSGGLKNESVLKTTYNFIKDFKEDTTFNNRYYHYIIDSIEYLLIPDVSDYNEQKRLYDDNQINVLKRVLEYNDRLNEIYSEACSKFNERSFANKVLNEIKNELDVIFNCDNNIKKCYKEIDERISIEYYLGNFVGKRGGITTNNGQDAKYTIIIIQTMYSALRKVIYNIEIDDKIRQFMLEKLNSYSTMLDPTVTFGYKVDRGFVKQVYDSLHNSDNKNYDNFVNVLTSFVINKYKDHLSSVNNN